MDYRLLKEYTREVLKEINFSIFPKGPFMSAAKSMMGGIESIGSKIIRAKYDVSSSNLDSDEITEIIKNYIKPAQKAELDKLIDDFMNGLSKITSDDEEIGDKEKRTFKNQVYSKYANFAHEIAKKASGLKDDAEDDKKKEAYTKAHDKAIDELKVLLKEIYDKQKKYYAQASEKEKESEPSS